MKNIETFLSLLKDNSVISDEAISEILYKECDYKKGSELPTVDNTWQSFSHGTKWGETRDTHCWFYFKAVVPVPAKGNDIYISVKTDKTGWDAENPQFIAYLNGECRQGLDLNHTEIFVEGGKEYEVYLYAYSGTPSPSGDNGKFASSLFVSLIEKNSDCEGLFYDVSVPFGITEYLDTDDVDYALLQNICVKTAEKVNFDAEGEVFYSSVKNARRFIKEQLYATQSHSDMPKIACIGHTHIDIAWMWTVAQAREKFRGLLRPR